MRASHAELLRPRYRETLFRSNSQLKELFPGLVLQRAL